MKFLKLKLDKMVEGDFWENYFLLNYISNFLTMFAFSLLAHTLTGGAVELFSIFIVVSIFSLVVPNVFLLCLVLIKSVRNSLTDRNFSRLPFVHILGLGLFMTFLEFIFTMFSLDIHLADWTEQLIGARYPPKHSFIWMESLPTIWSILLLSLLAFLIYAIKSSKSVPPLIHVFCVLGIYSGLSLMIVYDLQLGLIGAHTLFWFVFAWSVLLVRIKEWSIWQASRRGSHLFQIPLSIWEQSRNWLWFALLMAVPVYSVLLVFLQLFGQEPDTIIKAWTETADWTFSEKVAPESIIVEDEHYLCTVAARGHKRLVKPLRMGVRHGHWVKVNRQLCVANAFEQILEEKIPSVHHAVRFVYDRYGYPFASKIKNPFVMDSIYLLMKPLEWIFLAIIYMVDVKPENRISMQYISPIPADFQKKS